MNDNHAFAPEWVSNEIGIDIDDFSDILESLKFEFKVDIDGPLFAGCRSNFKIIESILVEPESDYFGGNQYSADYVDSLIPDIQEMKSVVDTGDGEGGVDWTDMGSLSLM
jgi:hypothetical protein